MTQLSVPAPPMLTEKTEGSSDNVRATPAAVPFFQRDAVRVAGLFMQFGLVVFVIRLFAFEGPQLADVATLACAGFLIHHFLPVRLRLPFFALLSVASILLAVGPRIGAVVVVAGLAIIGLCHARFAFWLRIVLIAAVGVLLFALRTTPYSPLVVVLASFFMLRVMIYLYDLKTQSAPFSPARATAYFFMLPNVCFPLFPLVDYKTFCTTYYNEAPVAIYQRGIGWMLRGLVHLLLYRVVYQFLQIDPYKVTDLGGVAQFMVTTYLLYLHVSGTFHLAVGMLHLFGFNLPETHHLYLLSASFLDLWRRINIYWKNFILKLFFNPAYFRFKKLGPTRTLILATVYSFFFTWLLHVYQFAWLRGTLDFTWQDTAFWWLLGTLVLGTALWEQWRGRQRAKEKVQRTISGELRRALCTIVTFVTLITMWTYWSSQSSEELTILLSAARNVTTPSVLAVVGGLIGLGVAAVLFGRSTAERTEFSLGTQRPARQIEFWRSAALVTAGCAALAAFGVLPNRVEAVRDSYAGEVMISLGQDRLNERDLRTLTRGYYEELDVTRNDATVRIALLPGPRWPIMELQRATKDFMLFDVIPDTSKNINGLPVSFNHWGLRGPACDKAKAPGVFRIAILGSSREVGHGVADGAHLSSLLEKWLDENDTNGRVRKYEVLNFAVEGYGAPQKLVQLERKVVQFQPDLVLFFIARKEAERTADNLSRVVTEHVPLTLSDSERLWSENPPQQDVAKPIRESLERLFAKAQVDPTMLRSQVERRMMPYLDEFHGELFQLFARQCAEHHVRGAFVYLPEVKEFKYLHAASRNAVLQIARGTGLPVLDLFDSYQSVADRDSLMVEPLGTYQFRSLKREGPDDHPNAEGHRMLTNELYRLLHSPEGQGLLKPRESNEPAPDEAAR
ncbi:MAG TPA: hypothetical protein VKE94_02935 [Gemmataceae bacterium]|nr:hypothetical protein [Gemmataceae bacterium]